MTDPEIDDVLAKLDQGHTLPTTLTTRLFPEARADRSTLSRGADGSITLRTYFHEHAAGHGWSCEQSEEETLGREALRARLHSL